MEDKKKEEKNILHKSGNIRELLKAGKSSNINLDFSRLSSKGFSNLLEKAKKMQEIKKKDVKINVEDKNDEVNLLEKKEKENTKKNNIILPKISEDFEILRKFSLRMNNKKLGLKFNNLLTSIDTQNTQNSQKEENYYGITTTANTNTNSNINSNFNTEKTKTKESIDNGNNQSKNEKEKDNNESSIDFIKKTKTKNINSEKRKYFHFYSVFNNLSNKNNDNKISTLSKFKQRNKNITIKNPDSLYQNSENIDTIEENNQNDRRIHNNNFNDNDNFKKNKNNENDNNSNFNNINNSPENSQNSHSFEYQPGPSHSSTEDILHDLDSVGNSLDKNDFKKEINYDDNSFNLKLYEKNSNQDKFDDLNDINDNDIYEYNYNNEEKNYEASDVKDNKILNFEDDEEEENNNEIDLFSKAMEYETVNINYSIKQCNTVLEYSFREDQNISYCPVMEDKSKSIENFNNNKNQMLFQLFDGYKGEEIPNFLQQNFTHIYKQYLDETKGNIPRSLVKSFKEIDEIIQKMPNIEGKSSTGTIIHIIWESKNKLMVYSGNVGNSRACLVSPAYVIKISQDQSTPETKYKYSKLRHKRYMKNNNIFRKKSENEEEDKKSKIFGKYKLNEEEEKEKEIKLGYKKYGRFKYKKENISNNNKIEESENKLIECIPYIAKMEIDLNVKNQFLFLASDGIWDKIDEYEIQQIIKNTKDTEQLCSTIVKNVIHRDTKDNISIFSIKLT